MFGTICHFGLHCINAWGIVSSYGVWLNSYFTSFNVGGSGFQGSKSPPPPVLVNNNIFSHLCSQVAQILLFSKLFIVLGNFVTAISSASQLSTNEFFAKVTYYRHTKWPLDLSILQEWSQLSYDQFYWSISKILSSNIQIHNPHKDVLTYQLCPINSELPNDK